MGYKCSFLDNETYGAEDVSRAFSRLMTAGVLAYPERDTVQDALNTLTSEVTTSGVSEYGGLEVSLTDTGAIIGAGSAFFESGVAIEVDSEGVEVNFELGTPVYITLEYQEDFNSVFIKATEKVPEGDVLVLAYIDANGNVDDRRSYAMSKIAINTANVYHNFTVKHSTWTASLENLNPGSYSYYTMPHNGFRYLVLAGYDSAQIRFTPLDSMVDLSLEGRQKIRLDNSTINAVLYVEKTGNVLKLISYRTNSSWEHKFNLMLV